MRSTVTLDAVTAVVGPVLPAESVMTEEALSLSARVPSVQEVTVRVKVVPEEADGVMTQPVEVPVLSKSPELTPLTALVKVRV